MRGTVYFLVLLLWVLFLVYGLLGSFKDSPKILKVQNANKCQWARPRQSIYADPQSQARGLLLHGLPSCSELLLITSRILSYILFFLWHYSDFGERNEALGSSPCLLSPSAFTFSLKPGVCPQISLLHQPLHTGYRKRLYCLPLGVFLFILGSQPLVSPFPEENQSVHHLKVFPNPLSPQPTVSSPSMFVYWPCRMAERNDHLINAFDLAFKASLLMP